MGTKKVLWPHSENCCSTVIAAAAIKMVFSVTEPPAVQRPQTLILEQDLISHPFYLQPLCLGLHNTSISSKTAGSLGKTR